MHAERRSFLRACGLAGLGATPLVAGGVAQIYVRASSRADGLDVRSQFPALSGAGSASYLDSAATTHRPQPVLEAIATFYREANANPARVHEQARRAAAALQDARETVARFVGAGDPLEIVFTRGTTEAVNLAASTWGAARLRRGDEIITTRAEHASNLLPWLDAARRAGATIRVLEVDEAGRLRLDQLPALLSPRTRLVTFSHVSNVLGIVNPARDITAAAKAAGATVFIDGAQSVPHLAVNVREIGCDFYAFSGHKMCGPMGSGVLWARRELLEEMPPYHLGSNMSHGGGFDRAPEYEHGALKFQAGTPDVAAPVGLAAAIRFLEATGRDAIWAHDRMLVEHARRRLQDVPGIRFLGSLSEENRIPVFTFCFERWAAAQLATALDSRGIAVRAGDLASPPLLERFGVREAVRASAYLYTTVADIDRLRGALDALV